VQSAIDRGRQLLGVGREADGLRLNRGIDRDALVVRRAPLWCATAKSLATIAQIGALVRGGMLEALLAGELEIRVVDPALARLFIG
jgi:hypothetical protein